MGMLLIRVVENCVTLRNIHGPNTTSVTTTVMILGIKVKDISCIWVTTWKMLMIKPTSMVSPKIGAATKTAVHNNSAMSCNASSLPTLIPLQKQLARLGTR